MATLLDNKGQPYISWKGTSANNVVPTWSRPLQGTEPYSIGPDFKARPIKHWRKQLIPVPNSGSGVSAIGILMDKPGSEVFLGKNSTSDCATCSDSNSVITKSIHELEKSNTFFISPEDKFYDTENQKTVCVSCNPEANVIKRASSIISKNYYQDRATYLKSRCKTFKQNISGTPIEGIQYLNGSSIVWPTDGPTGSQNYSTLDCCSISGKASTLIYKPNNVQYACQGAVDSSDRITRLKMNTINKNGASFLNAWGASAANAGSYHAGGTTPYFVKSKTQTQCVPFRRNGTKNAC